jgi:translation elongation factor P/translation initiation factor 5A
MSTLRTLARAGSLLLCLVLVSSAWDDSAKFPFSEKLVYRIEWHLVTAGTAIFNLSEIKTNDWKISLDLESAGVVTKLYRVVDTYTGFSDGEFCAANSMLEAQEGKRHRVTRLNFDNAKNKVNYEERDMVAKTTTSKTIDVYPCTREVAGALATLRMMDLPPGKTATITVTDGKKVAKAEIEAQAKETVSVEGKTYQTVRYEAFLFNNVLYKRKGRLFIWITDDTERLPVQLRVQLGFPIGNITLGLVKEERQ